MTGAGARAKGARGATASWVLYDVASSGYALMIPSVAYAVYFRSYVLDGLPAADAIWGMAVALPLVVAGLLGPLLGAMADLSGNRRRLLALATVASATATMFMAAVAKGDVLLGVTLFFVAHLGYMVAMGLYDSYLPLLARPGQTARISALGWGVGYLGGIAVFLLTLPLTRDGLSDATARTFAQAFAVTGAFYLLLALPALVRLPAGAMRAGRADAGAAYRRIRETVRGWRGDVEMPKFLAAYYLINDAVVSIAVFTPIFLRTTFGTPVQELLALTLLFNAIALPSTLAFGWLGDRWSQRGAIYATLAVWAAVLAAMGFAAGAWVPVAVAVLLGLVIGSTQSLCRSLFARMVPTERASEYFGFHSLAGKVSTALGPLVFGLVSTVTGEQRLAMLSLGLFFVAGAALLATVRLR